MFTADFLGLISDPGGRGGASSHVTAVQAGNNITNCILLLKGPTSKQQPLHSIKRKSIP